MCNESRIVLFTQQPCLEERAGRDDVAMIGGLYQPLHEGEALVDGHQEKQWPHLRAFAVRPLPGGAEYLLRLRVGRMVGASAI